MKICPKCGTKNVEGTAVCVFCKESLLEEIAPSKRFPLIGFLLMEGVAFLIFVFSMYVYKASDLLSALPYFGFALVVAIMSLIGAIVIHKKRVKTYTAYVERIAASKQQAEAAEPEEVIDATSYVDTLREVEAKLKQHRVVRSFDELSDFNTLSEQLCAYFSLCGYEVSRETCRMLTVAMASSRLVYLDIQPETCVKGVVEILNRYFGFGGHITTVKDNWEGLYAMLGQNPMGTANNRGTGVLVDLYTAKYAENAICCTYLDHVDPDRLTRYFYDFESYICDPMKGHTVLFRHDMGEHGLEQISEREFTLPANMWFFAILGKEHAHKLATKDAYSRSVKVRVSVTPAAGAESAPHIEKNPYKPVSYAHFTTMVSEFYEEYLLPEDMWCKWDRLVKYLNEEMGLKLGNSTDLTMENLSSMYMAIFSDWTSDRAMDFALSTHVLPKIRKACAENPDQLKSLRELTESVFGEDALPLFIRGIMPFGAVNANRPAEAGESPEEGAPEAEAAGSEPPRTEDASRETAETRFEDAVGQSDMDAQA